MAFDGSVYFSLNSPYFSICLCFSSGRLHECDWNRNRALHLLFSAWSGFLCRISHFAFGSARTPLPIANSRKRHFLRSRISFRNPRASPFGSALFAIEYCRFFFFLRLSFPLFDPSPPPLSHRSRAVRAFPGFLSDFRCLFFLVIASTSPPFPAFVRRRRSESARAQTAPHPHAIQGAKNANAKIMKSESILRSHPR